MILKLPEGQKRQITFKWARVKPTADFLVETMHARKEWNNFKVKEKCQPKILYLAKVIFKTEDETKITSEKQKLRECHQQDLTLKETLKA